MTAGKPGAPALPTRPTPAGPSQGPLLPISRPEASAGKGPTHSGSTARRFYENTSATRIDTQALIADAVRAEYPQLHLTIVPQWNCDLLSYAAAGHAGVTPIDKEQDRLSSRLFLPPAKRLNGSGGLADLIQLGKFLLDWRGKEYILYIVDCRDGTEAYSAVTYQFLLSPSPTATNKLLLEAGAWNSELHQEIWVFDGGYWQKSYDLWASTQKASWDDVILEQSMKDHIIADVDDFFNSRETYEKLKVPWKRGVIYYGPPGNGKTISIKAMMHTLYERAEPIPTLYVKSLSSFAGPEYSVNQIFQLARRTAPCYLVFEDLDSIVSDDVRSYFLNAVDGIAKNDGIFMVGSTNHLDRLDPGIAKRPSRFDRKYLFPNPDEEQRVAYMKYWQAKLDDNNDLDFPDKVARAAAKITHGFSFAYMQEAMIASLLAIAREKDHYAERLCLECMEAHEKPETASCDRESKRAFKGLYDWVCTVRRVDEEDKDLDDYRLWRELKKQIRLLREEMGDEGNRVVGRR